MQKKKSGATLQLRQTRYSSTAACAPFSHSLKRRIVPAYFDKCMYLSNIAVFFFKCQLDYLEGCCVFSNVILFYEKLSLGHCR